MKRLVLLLALFLGLFATAQKMTPKFLEGQWTSNGKNTELFFKVVKNNKLLIQEVSCSTKIPLTVLAYQISKNSLYTETVYEPNNWKAITKYIIIDENTMVADVVSDAPGQVTYKRIINN